MPGSRLATRSATIRPVTGPNVRQDGYARRQNRHWRAAAMGQSSARCWARSSEIIYQRLLMAREYNKPVVVSMGSVAASGGYWIAAAADEIWATPTTITGSIGVISAFPTADRLLDRLVRFRPLSPKPRGGCRPRHSAPRRRWRIRAGGSRPIRPGFAAQLGRDVHCRGDRS